MWDCHKTKSLIHVLCYFPCINDSCFQGFHRSYLVISEDEVYFIIKSSCYMFLFEFFEYFCLVSKFIIPVAETARRSVSDISFQTLLGILKLHLTGLT